MMDPEKMITALNNPDAYPEKTTNIRLVQTHISWVFICDEFVYKLKKPVNFGFLDFSTLELRKHYCAQEVALNRRLAKDVYLGVKPVVHTAGKVRILDTSTPKPEAAEIIEYAVKMRVVPDEVLLLNRFSAGKLNDDDITRVAKTISDFHNTTARSEEIDKFGSIETVKFNTDENFQQTQEFIGKSITREQFQALNRWTDEFYQQNSELFSRRISQGKIRDCHGDLHMQHICLTDPIMIIDCIEFNDRFRYSDTASDLAFLLMDLEYHNGGKFAANLYEKYQEFMGEHGDELELIMKYYKVYRAYVRGKVTSFQLNDPNILEAKKKDARKSAQKYFELAYSYIKN
jgi:aminoglycoside phosphotransferase family enzyme